MEISFHELESIADQEFRRLVPPGSETYRLVTAEANRWNNAGEFHIAFDLGCVGTCESASVIVTNEFLALPRNTQVATLREAISRLRFKQCDIVERTRPQLLIYLFHGEPLIAEVTTLWQWMPKWNGSDAQECTSPKP